MERPAACARLMLHMLVLAMTSGGWDQARAAAVQPVGVHGSSCLLCQLAMMLLSLLPPIITIIGISVAVHLTMFAQALVVRLPLAGHLYRWVILACTI